MASSCVMRWRCFSIFPIRQAYLVPLPPGSRHSFSAFSSGVLVRLFGLSPAFLFAIPFPLPPNPLDWPRYNPNGPQHVPESPKAYLEAQYNCFRNVPTPNLYNVPFRACCRSAVSEQRIQVFILRLLGLGYHDNSYSCKRSYS